ncbi:MAG: TMEM165/GDT1 family protein [Candidatus Woesearchaeota archaeon]
MVGFVDFVVPFLIVALSEFGDKTQLAIFALSSKNNDLKKLVFGVVLAFFLSSVIAVFFGSLISGFLSELLINIFAGSLFLLFGLLIVFNHSNDDYKLKNLHHPFFASFIFVFLSEFGDKSQIASGAFALNFSPVLVFLASFVALCLISFATIFVGRFFAKKFNQKYLSIISGSVFILIGIFYFLVLLF